MCTVQSGNNWDRPVNKGDVEILKSRHGCFNPKVIDDIYIAITDNAKPKAAVFVALVTLAHRLDHQKWSHNISGVALMPFSAMHFETGERYQAEGMIPFHDALLAFCLGMRNVNLLQKALAKYGMRFVSYHDCGCGITSIESNFENTNFYRALNHWRSWGEGVGKMVHHVDFDTIRGLPTDMCEAEVKSYERMWTELNALPVSSLEMPNDVRQALIAVREAVAEPLALAA